MYMTNQVIPFADPYVTAGDQFTNKEIRENQFYYVHDGSENLTDVIRLTVEDGVHSVPLAITVDVVKVDSHSPTLDPAATMTLLVTEGKLVSCHSNDVSCVYLLSCVHVIFSCLFSKLHCDLYELTVENLARVKMKSFNCMSREVHENHR